MMLAEHRYRGALPEPWNGFLPLPENRSAYEASRMFVGMQTNATERSDSTKLLYLHGPTGTGKSHLGQALVQETLRRKPRSTIQTITAMDLARLVTRPPDEENHLSALKLCDLLWIEDLHHLPSDASDGVARLFDHRQSRQRGIVVTAQRGPGPLHSLKPRLVSRLAAGLVVGLEPLKQTSRRLLAEHLCHERRLNVTPAVLDWLAQLPDKGARAMLGRAAQLELLARDHAAPLDLPAIQATIPPLPESTDSPLQAICERVARHYGIRPAQLRGKNRQRHTVMARQVGIWIARQVTALSLVEIGMFFGGRDHATVLHACRKIEALKEADLILQKDLQELQAPWQ